MKTLRDPKTLYWTQEAGKMSIELDAALRPFIDKYFLKYPPDEILALINSSASGYICMKIILHKHDLRTT